MQHTQNQKATIQSAAEFHLERLRSLRGRLSFEAQRRLDDEYFGVKAHERDLRDRNRKAVRA